MKIVVTSVFVADQAAALAFYTDVLGFAEKRRVEVNGMTKAMLTRDELLITITEMISLPKRKIKHYMSSPVKSIPASASFRDAFSIFTANRIHGAPVMDGDDVVGIVTLSDISRGIDSGMDLATPITRVMTRNVVTASPNINLYEVIGRFKEQSIGRLVIMQEGKPIGILTQSDIIRVIPAL